MTIGLYRCIVQELKGSYFGIRDSVKGSIPPFAPFAFMIFPHRLADHAVHHDVANLAREPEVIAGKDAGLVHTQIGGPAVKVMADLDLAVVVIGLLRTFEPDCILS
jgi:hypothetical protein